MDPVEGTGAGAEDAVTAVDVLVVVPGHVGAVLRVDSCRLTAAVRTVAERGVGAAEGRAGLAAGAEQLAEEAVGLVAEVGRVGVAARRVLEEVRRAGRGDLQADRAAVERVALTVGGLDPLLSPDDLARLGVDVGQQPAGSAIGVTTAGRDLPREPRRAADRVDDEPRGALDPELVDLAGDLVPGGDRALGPGLFRRWVAPRRARERRGSGSRRPTSPRGLGGRRGHPR